MDGAALAALGVAAACCGLPLLFWVGSAVSRAFRGRSGSPGHQVRRRPRDPENVL